MIQPQKTFEFGVPFQSGGRALLEAHLQSLWLASKADVDVLTEEEVAVGAFQGFVSFDGELGRAQNFVGFIQTENLQLEIYPKVFRAYDLDDVNCALMLQHVFWWLDYADKWRFPFDEVNLAEASSSSFPELLIGLIARQFYQVLAEQPLLLYQEEEAAMSTPRGRINFERYLSRGFSRGNAQVLECDYEPLVYDHVLNRAIKYVTRILRSKTRVSANRGTLEDILFLLDEVTDEPGVSGVLNRVRLNHGFTSYGPVMDSCRMILDQQLYSHQPYDQAQWSLLLPMELVFEEFIAGFIEREMAGSWKVRRQAGDLSLVVKPATAFRMRHDLLLTSVEDNDLEIIVDTKYKLRAGDLHSDVKKGVSQADMYQMTAYALRRGCQRVILLYPNVAETCRELDRFYVQSAFDPEREILIVAAEVPFWSMRSFAALKENLVFSLTAILNSV